jgi:hypothetical protein
MTDSLISSPSRPDPSAVAVIACGALAQDVARVAANHGWSVDVHPLPPLLHNHPHRIAPEVARLARVLRGQYRAVAVAYADCGSYGALDEVCAELGLRRLGGEHCYDVYAGQSRMRELLEREPGTYVLTDFLVRTFARTIIAELGLDRFPDLRDDYFRHYRRVVWLSQHPTPELAKRAQAATDVLRLPLTVVHVGDDGLARELRTLLCPAAA